MEMELKKNIYFAKIYFKEAIKQKEEGYSLYNLARIYYFGIDMKRKISKAIVLLENASMKQVLIADLFLFCIFSNCDDKKFWNQNYSELYYIKCLNNFPLQMSLINFNDDDNIQNLHKFLRDYDLIHNYDYSYDLLYFLLYGNFYDWSLKNDNVEQASKSLKKDMSADFYDGFSKI